MYDSMKTCRDGCCYFSKDKLQYNQRLPVALWYSHVETSKLGLDSPVNAHVDITQPHGACASQCTTRQTLEPHISLDKLLVFSPNDAVMSGVGPRPWEPYGYNYQNPREKKIPYTFSCMYIHVQHKYVYTHIYIHTYVYIHTDTRTHIGFYERLRAALR